MAKNLFDVGESVMLQSIDWPEVNGEYMVTQVLTRGGVYTCRISGKVKVCNVSNYDYLLDEVIGKSPIYPDTEAPWCETALRKKHTGCGEDWNIMMRELNTKIVEVV